MGIDYVIDLDCRPKQTLGIERIVSLIKSRSRAEIMLAMAREEGDQRPASEITFEVVVNRQGNVETTDVSVQQLLDEARALDPQRATCATCPANRDNPRGFGCYDSISYPIERDTEGFLLSRLPDKISSPAGYMFSSAMRDFAWDGAQAADMRAQGETFFRQRKAPVRRWPELQITGDQLFHMMFHVGHIQSAHAMMLCMFLGMMAIGEDPPQPEDPVEPETANAEQMIDFINTLAFAASQKLDVLVDG